MYASFTQKRSCSQAQSWQSIRSTTRMLSWLLSWPSLAMRARWALFAHTCLHRFPLLPIALCRCMLRAIVFWLWKRGQSSYPAYVSLVIRPSSLCRQQHTAARVLVDYWKLQSQVWNICQNFSRVSLHLVCWGRATLWKQAHFVVNPDTVLIYGQPDAKPPFILTLSVS